MRLNMVSVAILCLLLMERFLTSDMDLIMEPVLVRFRNLEKTALKYSKDILPSGLLKSNRKFTSFYLYTPELGTGSQRLDVSNRRTFQYFNPFRETKIIIHGFLDKADIADWMHHMKDEFLIHGEYNVIIVDWSTGNFIPYSQAAANTLQVGEEISHIITVLKNDYGADPKKFHLLGHSLGSHVAGYVGERVKGLKRITGLDPAIYLFKNASPRGKLDPSDAAFVDVIHTDAGGIGMVEPLGHVDFYPNGGEVQRGCTASNSLKSLLENGVVAGFRNMICSHMRATDLFIDTINHNDCHMVAYKCPSWKSFRNGTCDSCGQEGGDCATMGYHINTTRNYGNRTKYYLLTSEKRPYCGYEYKITLQRELTGGSDNNSSIAWDHMRILHIYLYGSKGNAEFQIEGNNNGWHDQHVVYSNSFLGDVLGSVIRWSHKSISRAKSPMDVINKVIKKKKILPFIKKMKIFPLKSYSQWKISPIIFELCGLPRQLENEDQQGASFRYENC